MNNNEIITALDKKSSLDHSVYLWSNNKNDSVFHLLFKKEMFFPEEKNLARRIGDGIFYSERPTFIQTR